MQKTPVSTSASQRDEWFDGIVSSLRSDQLQLQADIADSKKKQQYEVLIEGNPLKTLAMGRELTSKYFIGNIIKDFFALIPKENKLADRLALSYSNSKVLVWAVINDDDEKTEDDLLISEAKINAKYHEYGFNISVTIIEKSDNIPIPKHYQTI